MKKYLIWIIEAIIWLLIIIALIMGIFLYNHIKLKEKHSYHLFFKDTNGIRNGSPVKFMGNEIGYVSNVKVINSDEIFISFVITKKGINLPVGTTANIESTGLVGSRSLELYPPKIQKENSAELIIPLNPERVQGVFTNASRVAEILYAASNGLNKAVATEQIPIIRDFIHSKYKDSNTFGTKIDEINEHQDQAIKYIQENETLHEFNKKMEDFAK